MNTLKILKDNQNNFDAQVSNDNSDGQIILSGHKKAIDTINTTLKKIKKRSIFLPVSAPFHCSLMKKATEVMRKELQKINFKQSKNILISNVTANEISHIEDLKGLLIKQIEKRVRWRETILYMINKGVSQFIEIGPGKVLSGLVKRINKDVKISSINSQSDIESLNI